MPEQDAESPDGADDQRPDGTEVSTDTTPSLPQGVQPKPRGQRRRYEKAERELLTDLDLMSSVDPSTPLTVTVGDGSGDDAAVQHDNGDPFWIAEAIKRSAALVASLGNANPRFNGLAFENSVTFSFSASQAEVERSERLLALAEEVEIDDDDGREQQAKLLAQAVPPTLVGAHMATSFIGQAIEDPVGASIEYGTAVAEAWESFARHLAREDLTLSFNAPGHDGTSVSIRSSQAARVVEQMKEEHTRRPSPVTAVGVLSLADDDKKIVGLTLDREAARDPLLRGKQRLKLEITPELADSVSDQGLWKKQVRARVQILFDTDEHGRTTLNKPIYRLLSAGPRYE